MHEYITEKVCAKKIHFEIRDGKLYSVSFEDGCDGNLKALGRLLEGMDTTLVVKKLKGLCCGKKKTSCADQLVKAIEQSAISKTAI